MAGQFVINHKPYLAAVGNGTMLTVSRSLGMCTDDPRYLPIRQYVHDYGLVLYSEKIAREDDMFGRVEQRWYVTPEARLILTQGDDE